MMCRLASKIGSKPMPIYSGACDTAMPDSVSPVWTVYRRCTRRYAPRPARRSTRSRAGIALTGRYSHGELHAVGHLVPSHTGPGPEHAPAIGRPSHHPQQLIVVRQALGDMSLSTVRTS